MTFHVAVWIDHHEARIFHVAREGFDESTVKSPHVHIHRHPKGPQGDNREHPADAEHFHRDVVKALEGSGEILILGPSTAKLELIRYVHKHAHALEPKIVGVETVDHPTDPQIAAYARRYFLAADRMR